MNYNEIDAKEYEIRKQFLDDLHILNKIEKEELFLLLKKNKVSLSENSNGIFFDVSKIHSNIFIELLKFMNFCKENRRDFMTREDTQKQLADELLN